MISSTVRRVPEHTSKKNNERIQREIERNIAYYSAHPERIPERLKELDEEWDIERILEAQSSTFVVLGTVLGATVNRKFFIIPAIVGSFLLQHAIQGWCPPVPIWRRLGVRTQSEIESERYALKAIRGDFEGIGPAASIQADNEGMNRLLETLKGRCQ